MGVALASVATSAAAVLVTAPAAAARSVEPLTDRSTVNSVSAAQSEPMLFGLGAVGLLWLLAGLVALVIGLVLASRRDRRPQAGPASAPTTGGSPPEFGTGPPDGLQPSTHSIHQTTSSNEAGGATK